MQIKHCEYTTKYNCINGSLVATYWDRGRFVDHHNVLVHVHNGDRVTSDGHFMSVTLHFSIQSCYLY